MHIEPEVKKAMAAAFDHLLKELKSLRSSRANPALLDNVQVEIYSTSMRLKDVANVTVPEPRQLLVTPYDPNNSATIAKAIEGANLNVQPKVENNAIRIIIPPMDEMVRKQVVKLCKDLCEKAKVSIRQIRGEYRDLVKKEESAGNITKDDMRRIEENIQKETDHFCKEIDNQCHKKEKEILEV